MRERKEITLTVNGKQVKGKEGDTILEICLANDIYVPTLCYMKGLSTVGACRLCVVEIEGERRINPACTYPARDGQVVKTNTPNLEKYRCILCGRCVRTCGEIVGNHTLDFGRRGWRTLVVADLNQSLGQSSCITCGACQQACPTGAIFSKASAYRGRTSEGKTIDSLCSLCGVGCETKVLVKDNT